VVGTADSVLIWEVSLTRVSFMQRFHCNHWNREGFGTNWLTSANSHTNHPISFTSSKSHANHIPVTWWWHDSHHIAWGCLRWQPTWPVLASEQRTYGSSWHTGQSQSFCSSNSKSKVIPLTYWWWFHWLTMELLTLKYHRDTTKLTFFIENYPFSIFS